MTKRKFLCNGVALENVKEFCYLGYSCQEVENLIMQNKKNLIEQASKAMFWSLT